MNWFHNDNNNFPAVITVYNLAHEIIFDSMSFMNKGVCTVILIFLHNVRFTV